MIIARQKATHEAGWLAVLPPQAPLPQAKCPAQLPASPAAAAGCRAPQKQRRWQAHRCPPAAAVAAAALAAAVQLTAGHPQEAAPAPAGFWPAWPPELSKSLLYNM